MRNRSILTEAKQIQLATELISLGARLARMAAKGDRAPCANRNTI